MSEKYEEYEELAREYCIAAVGHEGFVMSIQWIADAFRWLDERRSKDVCEWVRINDATVGRMWVAKCGLHKASFDLEKYCPDCGRPIKEVPCDERG